MKEGQRFSIIARAKSLTHAGRGLSIFLKTTHNAWIEIALLAGAVLLGAYFSISSVEWILLILAAGFVLMAEAFNTAIEIDINLTSPDHHPYARDTKDVAAGAVVIACVTAFIIGLLLFVPHVFALIS